MLNYIWLALIGLAVLLGGFGGRLQQVTQGAIDGAQSAVTLAIGLIGIMALWLGMMRLAERSGLVQGLAHALRPLLRWLFPEIPDRHPAMGSMVMNIAANMLGLTNAATPLGLRAMKDLETLNRVPGTATNAMCTFLAINTSSVQLVPITAVAILAANGSTHPTAIVGTAFLATLCSSIAGITAVKLLQRARLFRIPVPPTPPASSVDRAPSTTPSLCSTEQTGTEPTEPLPPLNLWKRSVLVGLGLCFVWFLVRMVLPESEANPLGDAAAASPFARFVGAVSLLSIPFLLVFFTLYAALRRVPVYEEFVEGAKEGFQVGVRIIPFLVAMLAAVGMFRAAGGIEWISTALGPALAAVGFPAELLPISLIRPLTGSGTLAVFTELVQTHGADSMIARMAGTLFGSTETTFYVLVVYFGSVGIRRARHALAAGLIADGVGVIASVIICRLVFG